MRSISEFDFQKPLLRKDDQRIEVETSGQNRLAAVSLVQQTRRSLDMISRDLDTKIYAHPDFVDAIRQVVVAQRRIRVRILVQDTQPLISRGHRLVTLARRLNSFIELRVPDEEHQSYNSAYLIADRVGTLFRPVADRYEGTACFNDPREARGLTELFENMWESAEPDPNLRDLRI